MNAFYDFCFQAGPLHCRFYASSPPGIKERLDRLLEDLRVNPVIVVPKSSVQGFAMPELVTYSKVKRMISTALYQPIFRFRRVAKVLAALEAGDGAPFYEYTSESGNPSNAFCSAQTVPPTTPVSGPAVEGTDDAFPAIMCSDAVPSSNDTVAELEEFAAQLLEISSAAGAVQIVFRLSCVGRTIRPKWRFDGPFEGNTSFPILFVNNIADNVTPLVSATNNSAGFPGSVLLVQNSFGHTTLSAASTCTAKYVRGYFQHGTLPDPGTVCEPNKTPFEAAFFPDESRHDQGHDDDVTFAIETLARESHWGLNFQPRIF
jgi:hypothetical protein